MVVSCALLCVNVSSTSVTSQLSLHAEVKCKKIAKKINNSQGESIQIFNIVRNSAVRSLNLFSN